jgi:hypothetical protein
MKSRMSGAVKTQSQGVVMEGLESRLLMSGNVLATVKRGTLTIKGDADNNDIVVTAGANKGEFVISSGANLTYINGQANRLTVTGVTGDVNLAMGAGDDRVRLSGLAVAKSLSVDMGKGSDALTIGSGVSVGKNLTIASGGAQAAVSIANLTVSGSATLKNLGGTSYVTATGLVVGKDFAVRAGQSSDLIEISNSTVGGASSFAGTDVSLNGCTLRGSLKIGAGSNDGNVDIVNTAVAQAVNIGTGNGCDNVNLNGSTFSGKVTLATGKGDDTVVIDGSVFGAAFAMTVVGGTDQVFVATNANVSFNSTAAFTCSTGSGLLTLGSSANGSHATYKGKVTLTCSKGIGTLNYLTGGNSFAFAPAIKGFGTIQ